MHQQQFLNVIDRDEAERRFHAALELRPLGMETVPLGESLGRVVAAEIRAGVNVPSFDRSNFDGFAVKAADTFGATEERPRRLRLLPQSIATGAAPAYPVNSGECLSIATGSMLPRGADAVAMVEHTYADDDTLLVQRAVAPGHGVTFAGTDIATGEVVLRAGDLLTSRETGVLAAIGLSTVAVWRRPRVGILSTGDEILEPGQPMVAGGVYDSNARILADAVRELGAEPRMLGIARDDLAELDDRIGAALKDCDVVVLSGGTSKGAGDLSYRAISRLKDPGIVAHGVALKPGKPICLAVTGGKPVVILPGFPTSAIFTFHEFVAPVIRMLGGRHRENLGTVRARIPVKIQSEIGRTEYLLVGLVRNAEPAADGPGECGRSQTMYSAYPMGKGSGSVTSFSRADGFVTISRYDEIVPADTAVDVKLLGYNLDVADLVVMGSHCVGLDYLLGRLRDSGIRGKFLAIGSTAGLDAVRRGECDLAGMHLFDPVTGQYNRPFLGPDLLLIPGYSREQGILFRSGDPRFASRDIRRSLEAVLNDPRSLMVNRNQGSGTRVLIDRLLGGAQPPGYAIQPCGHTAVAVAISQGRADWGIAIRIVADQQGLDFLPLAWEQYDFTVLKSRNDTLPIRRFRDILDDARTADYLRNTGFRR